MLYVWLVLVSWLSTARILKQVRWQFFPMITTNWSFITSFEDTILTRDNRPFTMETNIQHTPHSSDDDLNRKHVKIF